MVNDSQAFILFTYKNLWAFLMFKLLLMTQTMFDFDVLLPWKAFYGKPSKKYYLKLSQVKSRRN